jgi:glutamine amidotransferase
MSDYRNFNVALIDLKLNNIFSIYKLLKLLNFKITIIDSYNDLEKFNILVLPGDGSFKEGMKMLKKNKLITPILKFSKNKNKKIIGICLGMQLLFENSNEFGFTKGIGIIKGKVRRLYEKYDVVPNIGWRQIIVPNIKVLKKFNQKFFYFAHSFHAIPEDKNLIASHIIHGKRKICSLVINQNIFGMQFHPEKSHNYGISLVKKIISL